MREFLKGLNLDPKVIDSIMREYGKGVNKTKLTNLELFKQAKQLREEAQKYKSQLQQYEDQKSKNDESLKSLQDLTNENKQLKTELQLSNSNVKKEFSKFVTSEVMSKVNDDNDFETVLNSYKKENPQYFGETVVKKVQSSPTLNGGETRPQTTNDIMNNLLRGSTEEIN